MGCKSFETELLNFGNALNTLPLDRFAATNPTYLYGVLQGAVLSPFFFTLHTYDLFSNMQMMAIEQNLTNPQ